MTKAQLSLDADLGYADVPVPDKIFVPIEAGKLGPINYKSHDTDPLAVEKVVIQYAGPDRIKIHMRTTGRISLSPGPDVGLGGLKVEVESGLAIKDLKLLIKSPRITKLDLPSLPGPVDKLIRNLLNRFLLNRLFEVIAVDLNAPFEKAKEQINQPIRFQLEIGKGAAAYEFNPKLESVEPDFKISQDGIHLRFDVTFAPELSLAQPKVALSRRAVKGVTPKRKRKRARRL
ncbi:hypothetical protein L0244_37765 [bacterium]|nr:hypothetical protein [bacterium]